MGDLRERHIKRICIFCGSSLGVKKEYAHSAIELGRILAQKKIALVYGGGRVGIMGQLAKACLEAGGEVIGVIPKQLYKMGLGYTKLTRLHLVNSMHERKAMMSDLSDGFIALPGGLGTIEEFFEALTWAQLGIHRKPCGLLNTAGYYDKLMEFIGNAVKQEFLEKEHKDMILVSEKPIDLMAKFRAYRAPKASKVIWVLEKTGNLV